MAYSAPDDLLLGDLIVSESVGKQKYVDDAADEINSAIGFLYTIPVVTDAQGVDPIVGMVLKRLNNWLATGRLIMALAAGGEDTNLHAYGLSLVTQAQATLAQIASGELKLPGAAPAPGTEDNRPEGASVSNVDEYSAVEAFYGEVMRPSVVVERPPGSLVWAPGQAG